MKEMEEMEEIKGLKYLPNILSEHKEQKMIEYIDSQPWENTLKRRTQQYGHRYVYNHINNNNENNENNEENNQVGPIPKKFLRLFQKLRNKNIGNDIDLDKLQVIVNEYQPRQGIAAHIDDPKQFGEWIISVSIGSGCNIKFSNSKENKYKNIYIDRRSVYEMKDDARYKWKHQIECVKTDIINNNEQIDRERRISITFRYIK
jgi:alkylated DNA repair dioxygenase AlkB